MSHELRYTSAPRGLKPGSIGYCTVACTPDLPTRLASTLEGLSDYRAIPGNNPVAWSHLKILEGIRELSVLSRRCAAVDHTGRQCFFAHHVVLEPAERPRGGPAWALGQKLPDRKSPHFLDEEWDGFVGILPAGREPPLGDRKEGMARAWEREGLKPGWAGVLAESVLADSARPVYVIYRPGRDLLPLLEDALALVPVEQRWSVTFSTYFTGLPPSITCAWRCVLADSPEAIQARRVPRALVLDLDALGEPTGGTLVALARTGVRAKEVAPDSAIRSGTGRRSESPRPVQKATTTATAAAMNGVTPALGTPLVSLRGERRERSTSWGLPVVLAGSCVLVVGMIAWFATRGSGDPDAAMKAARSKSQKHSARADADLLAAAPIKQVEADASSSRDLTAPPPEPVSTPSPEATVPPPSTPVEPTPAPPPRHDNVKLPAAAPSAQGHDGDVRAFDDLALPAPGPVTLALRGLDDPQLEQARLVVGPTEPGNQVSLVVQFDPQKGSNTRQPGRDPKDLGRFWVEGDRLRFQWAESPLKDSLVEPSRALRDCILEVRSANKGTLALALRAPLKDAKPLTVSEGFRAVGWGREHERPSRPLAFGRCEVQVGEGWTELPSVTPHSRELVLLDVKAQAIAEAKARAKAKKDADAKKAKKDADAKAKAKAKKDEGDATKDDDAKVKAKKDGGDATKKNEGDATKDDDANPASEGKAKADRKGPEGDKQGDGKEAKTAEPPDVDAGIDVEVLGYEKLVMRLSLNSESSELHVDLDPSIKLLDQGITESARAVKQLNARAENLRKNLIPSTERDIFSAKGVRANLLAEARGVQEENPDRAEDLNRQARVQEKEIGRLGTLLGQLKAELEVVRFNTKRPTELNAALTTMRKTAEPYLKAPIRLRLEYKIEGQMFEAATIGPE